MAKASSRGLIGSLPTGVQPLAVQMITSKFDAYLLFTSPSAIPRSVPKQATPPAYVYPDASMISDLTVFWSLFCEVYEEFGGPSGIGQFIVNNPCLLEQIHRIIEDGEYWCSAPNTIGTLGHVPLAYAVPGEVPEICRILRNGYAHFHWVYSNLSALDYWQACGWDTTRPQTGFALAGRPANNYTAYVVDAGGSWNATSFWQRTNLRIIVTKFHLLRYHLHLFLNMLLKNDPRDIFGCKVWP